MNTKNPQPETFLIRVALFTLNVIAPIFIIGAIILAIYSHVTGQIL